MFDVFLFVALLVIVVPYGAWMTTYDRHRITAEHRRRKEDL